MLVLIAIHSHESNSFSSEREGAASTTLYDRKSVVIYRIHMNLCCKFTNILFVLIYFQFLQVVTSEQGGRAFPNCVSTFQSSNNPPVLRVLANCSKASPCCRFTSKLRHHSTVDSFPVGGVSINISVGYSYQWNHPSLTHLYQTH